MNVMDVCLSVRMLVLDCSFLEKNLESWNVEIKSNVNVQEPSMDRKKM